MTFYSHRTNAWGLPSTSRTGWDDDVVKPVPSLQSIMTEQAKVMVVNEPQPDVIDEPTPKVIDEPSVRTEAFEQLRHIRKETFVKTKMCKYRRCKKPQCMFAHTIDELIPKECFFKDKCRVRTCHFMHPGETKQDYLNKIL